MSWWGRRSTCATEQASKPALASESLPRSGPTPMRATRTTSASSSHREIDMVLPPFSASLGAMGSLAEKLDALMDTELKDEIGQLKTRLYDLSKTWDPPFTARRWMKGVRGLSYEMENCVDTEIDWIDKISRFKARVKDSNGRYDRYDLKDVLSHTNDIDPIAGHRLPTVNGGREPDPVIGLHGEGGAVDRLCNFLTDGGEQLKVLSIVGVGGIGKTTLAKQLWRKNKPGDYFDCRAFVRTAKKPDMRRILRSILAQVRPHQPPDANEVQELIDDLVEHLQNKRYFLIIDDLWATSVWDVARCAFPEGIGSRILTTTEIEDVALACCSYQSKYIFKMEPLSHSHSKALFTSAVFGSGEENSRQLDEVSDEIIRRCAGLPQAIISVSSVLASQGEENTVQNREKIQNYLPINTTPNDMLKQVLKFCYNCLPSCLQTCLLYLSLYPENYMILKEDIIKQWVAEGFICAPTAKDKLEVALSYFDKLVNMGLIQHIDVEYSNEVSYYAVHHMVHDIITSKSVEENFITVLDYSKRTTRFSNKVSRLSLQFGSATYATTPASTGLSQVRSLAFIGLMSCFPSILEFKLLRILILHIWGDQPSTGFNLGVICEFFLMRYLQVTCNDTVHLPHQMQGLKHLETIEINARISAIPSDIFHLQSLLRLRLGGGTELPDVTGIAKNVTMNTPPSASGRAISLDDLSSPPDSVQTIELLPPICRMPKWTGQLSNLCILKIVVRELQKNDISNLQGLPALTVLSLYVQQRTSTEPISFVPGAFAALEYFEFRCTVLCLAFEEGTMPSLQRIKLGFNVHKGEEYGCSLLGIEHLSNVQEISGIIGVATSVEEHDFKIAESAFRKDIGNHVGNVSVKRADMCEEDYGPPKIQHLVRGIHLLSEQPASEKQESREEIKQSVHINSQLINRKAVMAGVQEVSITVVGWFATPNITELMRVARECAATRYKLFRGNKKELEKLVEGLEGIKRLLDQASTTFVMDQARLDGLWRLKDDIHDAEEVLDHFMLQMKATSRLIDGMKSNKDSLSNKLVKVLKNLEETSKRARDLLHQVPQCSISRKAETGPSPVRDKRRFFGYHDEYNKLYSLLQQQQQPDGNGNKVIAILGHGGMGKTELARQAFRDAKDKFDLRIWVHAYSKNTEFDLLREIWKSVAGGRPVGEMNVTCLQKELEKLLASKRCLLVVDDVWNHEQASSEVERKQACAALDSFMRFAKQGSRIVVTTRAKICSTTLSADETIVLDGIKPEEMTRLVNETANLGTDCSKIQELLNKQVPKLKGSPLAAIEIGDELKQQTTSSKRCEILEDIEQHLGSVLSNHLFTYRHLPPHLQRCFEFCSIFPNNWRFEPEKLTRMWIAHGFVEGTQQGRSMEDVARGYFDSLVDRSLFQEAVEPGGAGGREKTYVIHEQNHWMIRLASAKNCISISATGRHSAAPISIPTTVRHLSVTSGCLDQLKECNSWVLNNVRTLLILKNDDGGGVDTTIDKGILKQFQGVRVLDLTQTGLTQLPGTIDRLKHVRYLGLPSTMRTLCEQLTELLFLQTFSVSTDGGRKEHTSQLNKFPKNMNRLINMRHLDINTDCITNISGIGTMVKLQGSIVFQTMRASEKEGHSVSELAEMSSLSGTLSIKGLDAVGSNEEAAAAQLASKGSVKVLKLEWGPPDPRKVNDGRTDAATAVLEGLQPHCDLRDLHITMYPGASSPSWLMVMNKLTRLYLRNCRRLRALPALGGLPCLELLDIKELTIIERIDGGFCGSSGPVAFPSLKTIVLDDMPELVAWDDMPKGAFPMLSDISIIDCPKLSLSGLALEWCRSPPNMRVKGCPAITPGTLPKGVSTCKFS